MKQPFIIGITGGIGSGKSTFCRGLEAKGELVYDTDLRAKELQEQHPSVICQTKKLFGNEVYGHNGLNRSLLAQLVFSDKHLLHQLNEIVHPAVREDIATWIRRHSERHFLFIDCALLLEGDIKDMVDAVLLITAPTEVRVNRVIKRDGSTKTEVAHRMRHQMPEEDKKRYADWIIDTTDEVAPTTRAIDFLSMLYDKYKIDKKNSG